MINRKQKCTFNYYIIRPFVSGDLDKAWVERNSTFCKAFLCPPAPPPPSGLPNSWFLKALVPIEEHLCP